MSGDRHLSQIDYLDILQWEYFVNMFKSKIYTKLNDRNFYKKVMSHKKDKILDLSRKNYLPNVFDDKELFEKYRALIFPKQGITSSMKLTDEEIAYYYSKDSDVRINQDDSVLLGKISSSEGSHVKVKIRGTDEIKPFLKTAVTRIFY